MSKLKFTILTLVAFTIFSSSAVIAQEEKEAAPAAEEKTSPFDAGLDIYSSYIWRGSKFGSGPAFQPWVEAGFGGFAIGAWGSVNASKDEALEMDLYLGYSFDFGLSINVTDYYFGAVEGDSITVDGAKVADEYGFFHYGDAHYIEPSLSYEIGGFSATAAYMFGPGFNGGDIYFEAGYSWNVVSIAVGAGDGAYTSKVSDPDGKFMVCNVTLGVSKEIQITDKFSLPLSGSVTINPATEGFYATVGISF